jgi:hypothetical protein
LSMLHHFFASHTYGEQTKGLFDKLEIASVEHGHYMQYQGQYPVIFMNLKDVAERCYDDAIESIYGIVQRSFNQFADILNHPRLGAFSKQSFEEIRMGKASHQILKQSLLILSECLSIAYNKKVYILIDEYDKPLNHAYQYEYFDEFSDFMKGFLSAGFKDNPYLEKGIMTGILRLSKANMLSGLNNLKEYTLLDNTYAKYFGFTEDEVADVFKKTGLSQDLEKVKAWYNGYNIGGLVIYNPWSIMSCIDNAGELRPYWIDTADNSLIEKSIMNASRDIKYHLKELLEGKSIEVDVERYVTFDRLTEGPIALWSLLLFAGYLRIDHIDSEYIDIRRQRCKLSLPNKEVKLLFFDFVYRWFEIKIGAAKKATDCLKSLLVGDVSAFTEMLGEYLMDAASVHDVGDNAEMFYHGFVLALVIQARDSHYIRSNRESGKGRYDVAVFPKTANDGNLGILLEFKRVKTDDALEIAARAALGQIDDKQYDHELKQYAHIQNIVRIGIVFSDKAVLSAYQQVDCKRSRLGEVLLSMRR